VVSPPVMMHADRDWLAIYFACLAMAACIRATSQVSPSTKWRAPSCAGRVRELRSRRIHRENVAAVHHVVCGSAGQVWVFPEFASHSRSPSRADAGSLAIDFVLRRISAHRQK
jgi:hypothetical protein